MHSPIVRLSAPRFMSLTSKNYTQRHLFTGRRNNGADYCLVYLITSIRDVRGYRSNGQVGRTTASACACTEITLRTLQDSKALRQKAMAQGHLVPMRRFNVVSPRANRGATLGAIARGFSSHKRTSISPFKHRHAIDATANRSRRSRRVAGQNTTNRLAKPEAYAVLNQTMGLSRPAELVLLRQF